MLSKRLNFNPASIPPFCVSVVFVVVIVDVAVAVAVVMAGLLLLFCTGRCC